MNRVIDTFAFAATAMIAATSFADTVAWWHFDEQAPGTTATSDVITESISGAKATSYTITSNKVEQIDAYRPVFWRTFPDLAVCDPVTGTTNENHSAAKFKIASVGDAKGGRAYYGGALKVDGGDSLYADCKSAITVEAFVCTTGGVYNLFAPIVGCVTNGNFTSEPWALYMLDDGTVVVRHNSTAYYQNDNKGKTTINDGFWHHVAWTWDGSTIRVYVDYKLDKKSNTGADRVYSRSGTFSYPAGKCATWIGGYSTFDKSNGGRKFPGLVDEVRISNVALTPDKFLRLVPATAEDADSVLHLRFDSDASVALEHGEVVGGTIGGIQAIYNSVADVDASSFDTAAKVGDSMSEGIYSDGVLDLASYSQSTNGAGKSNYIKVAYLTDKLFPSGVSAPSCLDYTVEAFFKFRCNSPVRQSVFKIASGSTYLVSQVITGDAKMPHQFQFAWRTNSVWQGVTSPSSRPIDDGNWHHVAFVSDAANNRILTYYDYTLLDTRAGATPEVPKGYSIFIGANENKGQFFDGWIDDVRVMKRALRPEEFLTTHSVGSASPNPLLLAKFEQNYDFECDDDAALSVTGAGSARTGGSAPVFEKVSPGALLLDGTNGSQRVDNDWSVRLNKSRVVFPVSRLYENDAYTVEFWAKFTGFDGDRAPGYNVTAQHAGILRFVQGSTTTLDWYLYRPGDKPDNLQLAFRDSSGSVSYHGWDMQRIVADGRWHHYALSFSQTDDDTKTQIELYGDYESRGTKTVNSLMHFEPGGHRLMVGESSTDAMPNILGYVNSLRLTRGVLTPDKFMGRVRTGAMLIFR